MYKNNAQTISKACEKMKNNELKVEDILDEEDLVNDLKSPSFSQLISFLNSERLEKLMDYALKEPNPDADKKLGHKFPYFACEILCSENVFILEKFFEDVNKHEGDEDESHDGHEQHHEKHHEEHHVEHHEDHHEEANQPKVSIKEKYFDEGQAEDTKEESGSPKKDENSEEEHNVDTTSDLTKVEHGKINDS